MKLLLVLLSVMTWTVQSKSTVTGDGDVPHGIEVDYACSYQKGTVRNGDVAVLNLGNLGGITVNSIDVYVKSNKNEGAGIFTVTANGATIATKSGTLKEWTGAYDNTNYHAIRLINNDFYGINDLSISLQGTANSLYIDRYVITYVPAPAYTVTLMNGSDVYTIVTEKEGGQGVLLPDVSDFENWQFIGWSDTEFWILGILPTLYYAYNQYYPKANTTLWAVYRYLPKDEQTYVTDLQSGYYLYVNRSNNSALTGVPDKDGIMDFAPIDRNNSDLLYYIDFIHPDTAYITHAATNTPIGYSGTKLVTNPSKWLVYHAGEETTFYCKKDNKIYALFFPVYTVYADYRACLINTDLSGSPMSLMLPQAMNEPVYTCHPEAGLGVEETQSTENGKEYILHFGNYELHIVNGHKFLQLR